MKGRWRHNRSNGMEWNGRRGFGGGLGGRGRWRLVWTCGESVERREVEDLGGVVVNCGVGRGRDMSYQRSVCTCGYVWGMTTENPGVEMFTFWPTSAPTSAPPVPHQCPRTSTKGLLLLGHCCYSYTPTTFATLVPPLLTLAGVHSNPLAVPGKTRGSPAGRRETANESRKDPHVPGARPCIHHHHRK